MSEYPRLHVDDRQAYGNVTRPPLAESVSPVMKLDSSLSRKRITDGNFVGLADPAQRRFGHDALHRFIGQHVGHLGLDQAGGHAIDAHAVRGERLGAAAGQRDHARLG